jgi:ribonuclease R
MNLGKIMGQMSQDGLVRQLPDKSWGLANGSKQKEKEVAQNRTDRRGNKIVRKDDRRPERGAERPERSSGRDSDRKNNTRELRDTPSNRSKQLADVLEGKISFHEKGFAFVKPDEGAVDVFIAPGDTGTALHGDRVRVKIIFSKGARDRGRIQGHVMEVVERKVTQIVGTLRKEGATYIVSADDSRILHDFIVPEDSVIKTESQPNDKVIIDKIEWKKANQTPRAVICERIGEKGAPFVDIVSIIKKFQLPLEFPEFVLREASHYHADQQVEVEKGRLDLREDFVITIDPDTAKDFDDAISLKKLPNGVVEVGIHIADVAHYVRAGSALDKEARKRGNSVYLVDRVIPMLPEVLSNGLCSLVPHQDRLTFSVFAELDKNGKILKHRATRSVIHSKHRLTYQQALEKLEKNKPQDDLDQFLWDCWSIGKVLRKNRFAEGALDLDMPEVKVYLDEVGHPTHLTKEGTDIAHQLIEEFMLLANEVVAKDLKERNRASMYRVHETPDPEKLGDLQSTLEMNGIKVGDLLVRKEIQKAIKEMSAHPNKNGLMISLLKSLKRAMYDTKSLGHYGLAKVNYTHFTSPIRRYCDLIVHRALAGESLLGDGTKFSLEEIAEHISLTERTAAEAENETKRLKILEYFSDILAQGNHASFPASIIEIQNFGFFVELTDFPVSGLVHGMTFKGGTKPTYNEKNGTLVAGETIYKVGDQVKVAVENINLDKKQVDFRLA